MALAIAPCCVFFLGWKVMLPKKTLMSAETGSFHISAKRATRQDFSQSRERALNCGYGESQQHHVKNARRAEIKF